MFITDTVSYIQFSAANLGVGSLIYGLPRIKLQKEGHFGMKKGSNFEGK